MAILIAMPGRDTGPLVERLRQLDPELDLRVWPEVGAAADVDFAVLWQQPTGLLAGLPNLRAVTSYGAGVDFILADPELPDEVQVGRVVGARLVASMREYLLAVVLAHRRGVLRGQQIGRVAQPSGPPRIGVLGLGELGRSAAQAFAALGCEVAGWRRESAPLDGVSVRTGSAGLRAVAARAEYLLCLLPLTPATRGILRADLFSHCRGAYLVNAGRGAHLVTADLQPALDAENLCGACLDVTDPEPLPADHPLRSDPRVLLTGHTASLTDPDEAARQVLDSYYRVRAGDAPLNPVDSDRGY